MGRKMGTGVQQAGRLEDQRAAGSRGLLPAHRLQLPHHCPAPGTPPAAIFRWQRCLWGWRPSGAGSTPTAAACRPATPRGSALRARRRLSAAGAWPPPRWSATAARAPFCTRHVAARLHGISPAAAALRAARARCCPAVAPSCPLRAQLEAGNAERDHEWLLEQLPGEQGYRVYQAYMWVYRCAAAGGLQAGSLGAGLHAPAGSGRHAAPVCTRQGQPSPSGAGAAGAPAQGRGANARQPQGCPPPYRAACGRGWRPTAPTSRTFGTAGTLCIAGRRCGGAVQLAAAERGRRCRRARWRSEGGDAL